MPEWTALVRCEATAASPLGEGMGDERRPCRRCGLPFAPAHMRKIWMGLWSRPSADKPTADLAWGPAEYCGGCLMDLAAVLEGWGFSADRRRMRPPAWPDP